MINKNYLICKRVAYYSLIDEGIFFDWINRIDCVVNFEGGGDELYLDLKNEPLTEQDLYELLCFFKRYKVDMKQLKPFLTKDNTANLQKRKSAFWYKRLFGE